MPHACAKKGADLLGDLLGAAERGVPFGGTPEFRQFTNRDGPVDSKPKKAG